jgi:hypothetical protein
MSTPVQLPEYIDNLPNICGFEEIIGEACSSKEPIFIKESKIDFPHIKSAAAIALHMQQPLVPAGGADLQTAEIIGHLQYMYDNQHCGDNHNAPVFHWCYKRIGEFIPAMVEAGLEPRIMLDYSGCLLHGLRKQGLNDVIDELKKITLHPAYRHCVEWLGCTWGHAVAPSTPVQDYRLHVTAWQHHFASIFGLDALKRVKGFSLAEMALPNHPDVAYELIRTLRECGYEWIMVQEHTVEDPATGRGTLRRHIPHKLVCRNSAGQQQEIIAIVKTQGSDTKLVAQMQPWFEACSIGRVELAGKQIPPLVVQIGDGENGGVMMNEFPPKYKEVVGLSSHSMTPLMNVTEYLEYLQEMGITIKDLPPLQPVHQKKIWDSWNGSGGADGLNEHIQKLKHEDHGFHMEGGSWTNNISWVKGYENVLEPMNLVSARFSEKILGGRVPSQDRRYREALFHLLASQTSCYRYWGQGLWTDYAREICRRAMQIIEASHT